MVYQITYTGKNYSLEFTVEEKVHRYNNNGIALDPYRRDYQGKIKMIIKEINSKPEIFEFIYEDKKNFTLEEILFKQNSINFSHEDVDSLAVNIFLNAEKKRI